MATTVTPEWNGDPLGSGTLPSEVYTDEFREVGVVAVFTAIFGRYTEAIETVCFFRRNAYSVDLILVVSFLLPRLDCLSGGSFTEQWSPYHSVLPFSVVDALSTETPTRHLSYIAMAVTIPEFLFVLFAISAILREFLWS